MERVLELVKILSELPYECSYSEAKATGTCIVCGESARDFRDRSAKFEYDISGLCQSCQDEFLGNANG